MQNILLKLSFLFFVTQFCRPCKIPETLFILKETVPQALRLQVFCMNHFQGHSNFSQCEEIFASQGAPLVSTTPVANLPPVLTTPTLLVAKFAAGVVDTGFKFATGGVGDTGDAP
jgi:hypothetical protein